MFWTKLLNFLRSIVSYSFFYLLFFNHLIFLMYKSLTSSDVFYLSNVSVFFIYIFPSQNDTQHCWSQQSTPIAVRSTQWPIKKHTHHTAGCYPSIVQCIGCLLRLPQLRWWWQRRQHRSRLRAWCHTQRHWSGFRVQTTSSLNCNPIGLMGPQVLRALLAPCIHMVYV